ncbi:MAG: helix-turn-helix domain-containing protein [Gammaproteobacteria bacterium]|nr:helix-turn-helix domain-containing protein [Gammaproteobacteria bacterium]
MTSLARGLLVIRAFSGLRRTRSIADISRSTGLSRAAVRRCLYTLCELGYAACEDRTYRLLPKVLGLGHGAVLAAGIEQLAAARASPVPGSPQTDSRGSSP